MHVGNSFENIRQQMETHGMSLPSSLVTIGIPDARSVLQECFSYFLSAQGKTFVWQSEYEEVAEWLTGNEGRGLFLYGDCGRGKSFLARYVLPAIILNYMQKVVSVYDVQQMNRNLDEVLTKHIISLDDIGTEEVSMQYGNRRFAFAEVMDAAEKYGKLVIISTNLCRDEIVRRYGERVFERIISMTRRIEFKGKSLRG